MAHWSVWLLVCSFLRIVTPARGDAEVSCVFMESCILPCSFQGGTDVVIYWIQETTGDTVHSYYHNQDQLAHQDQHFRGRTSLFRDQISRGNASLQLTGVEIQDQGRYMCYTSTIRGNTESFINLNVDAPVVGVDIQQVENRITCSSEGIYPEPELTWSTSPPSNVTFKNTTTVQQTEQQLYSISSSLILSDSVTDLVYSCTISTRRNRRRATLRQLRSQTDAAIIVIAVVAGVISVVLLAGLVLYWKYKKTGTRHDMVPSHIQTLWKEEEEMNENRQSECEEEAEVEEDSILNPRVTTYKTLNDPLLQ